MFIFPVQMRCICFVLEPAPSDVVHCAKVQVPQLYLKHVIGSVLPAHRRQIADTYQGIIFIAWKRALHINCV